MGKYRKIDPRIWNDEHFHDLTDQAKLLFLFLLTHPHLTALGAMRATPSGLSTELGWKEKEFRKVFDELLQKPFINSDEKFAFVSIPNFIKYNQPENPNVLKSWESALDYIPECSYKYLLIQDVKVFAEGLGEAFAKALPEGFKNAKAFGKGVRKPLANHEQDHEQEQEQDSNTRSDSESESSEPYKILFPLCDKTEWGIVQSEIDSMADLYPGVDIEPELLRAKGWLISNPTRRKTGRGMSKFLYGWVSRAQDKSKGNGCPKKTGTLPEFVDDFDESKPMGYNPD